MKELSEYDFKYKEFEVVKKKIGASKLFEELYIDNEYCFLYESLESSGRIGRFSILGGKPSVIFKFKNSKAEIILKNKIINKHGDPFSLLKSIMKLFPNYPAVLPFSGGAIGYISYDSIRYIENIPDKNIEDPEVPEFYFIFPSEIIISDNKKNTVKIIVYGEDEKYLKTRGEYLKKMIKNTEGDVKISFPKKGKENLNFNSGFTKEEFEKSVEKAKGFIEEGDIFQVVLSRRVEIKTDERPFEIFKRLRLNNPSPYMYYLKFKDLKILGSSPEILIKLERGKAVSRPIAGTRRRGKTDKEDKGLEKELLSDKKELAEHIMLVDLARNDLGKVCRFGTVITDELISIEKYSKVMHIVSNITGVLSEDCDSFELFKSSFPAGTVSGSPKIRAMEIIDSLEPVKRGIYAGGIGYFSFNGDMDFCIAIRTIIIDKERVFVQAGAGIVSDSIPEREYKETLNKTEALILTLSEER